MTYAIRFDYPDGGFSYAGIYQGAQGWAPTLATAQLFTDEDAARRTLANGYGEMRRYGRVVEVRAPVTAAVADA